MFTVSERAALRDALRERASADERVESAALVGSLATDTADRWSDIDIALGVADRFDPMDVLSDWTTWLAAEVGAAMLLDWPVGSTVYRIFLLPSSLQVDVSVTRASEFTRRSPRFQLLFGRHATADTPPASQAEAFGYAAVYAIEARRDIERGRAWQAQHFISQVRDHALTLACLNRGLPDRHGRGYDQLPGSLLDAFVPSLVTSLAPPALRAALASAVGLLLAEAEGIAVAGEIQEALAEVAHGPFA